MIFTKMHGCGNDYVYMDCTKDTEEVRQVLENASQLAIRLSDRHFGIGSDGLILICPSEVADFRMRMYNADGSESEMCGNGIRCVSKFVYDKGLTDQTVIRVETGAGILTLDLHPGKDELIETVTVDMGVPVLTASQVPVLTETGESSEEELIDAPIQVDGVEYRMTCISMGNPHAVIFVEETASLPLTEMGPKFENHPRFPKRTNTEFIQLLSRTEMNMRVWERGSGETLACGTGTCASVMAAILNGHTEDEVLVHLLGGDLIIRYDRESGHIFMTGPATTVFEGEIIL